MTLSRTDHRSAPSDGERAATELLSPDGRHRLLNDTVFQFNDQYRRFWRRNSKSLGRVNGEKVVFIVPIMFDKASRTFNWIALSDPFLGHSFQAGSQERDDARAERRKAIARFLDVMAKAFPKSDEMSWNLFRGRFSDSPHAQAALKCVERYIHDAGVSRENLENSLEGDELTRLWIAAATIHSCYSHPRDQYFEGLFYHVLESFGWQHPNLVGSPVFGLLAGNRVDLSDWLRQPDIAEHADDLKLDRNTWCGAAALTMKEAGYSEDRVTEAKVAEDALLYPLLMNWNITESGQTRSFTEWIGDFNLLVLQPLFDVWIGHDGFGSLEAVLVLLLKPDPDGVRGRIGKPSMEGHYNDLLERCDEFAREVSQTSVQRALATPITPPYDLVRHFLRILKEVQDWEEATVFYDGNASYCFRRPTHSGSPRPVRTGWEEKPAGLDGPVTQAGGMIEDRGGFYMWWTCKGDLTAKRACYNLWSQDFLADLNEDERAAFQGTSIRFKFPKACRIPHDAAPRSFMVESYLRRQLELMRVLIPKVRARRAALRNAISAIMGRNMSHNIGSHVLARYANKVNADLTVVDGKPDPRSDFLLYLQRRMDFLAEVATSDRSLSAQPLVLKEQLEKLNLDVQRKRYDFKLEAPAGSLPLLQNITGKHDLNATVVCETCGCAGALNLMFACPGGEVGVHALFVILENIIRNSARHNGGAPAGEAAHAAVTITVRPRGSTCTNQCGHATQTESCDGLIELRINDPRTRLDAEGLPLSSLEDGNNQTVAASVAAKSEKAKAESDKPLHKRINEIIEKKPIIEEDGRPSPHFWGIREMQVCAQYLRQLPLSDLEDGPYPESDPAADKAPVIKAECVKLKGGAYCLSYVIYLQEARLLAVLETADEDAGADAADPLPPGILKVTVRRDRPRSEPGDLAELGSYSFVAYPSELSPWVWERRADLPIRMIALPAPIEGGILDTNTIIEQFRVSPLQGLELLHESYTRQACGPRVPVGLVIAKGQAPELRDQLTQGHVHIRRVNTPRLAPLDGWFNDHQNDDLSIWLDHPSVLQREALMERQPRSLEPWFSSSVTSLAIEQLGVGRSWELLAASVSRILVLDERVQAQGGTPVRDNLTYGECWGPMRISVPGADTCNLDHPNGQAIREYLCKLGGETIDFVIVHLTILERLCAQFREDSIFSTLHGLFGHHPAFATSRFIVVTGRGVPAFVQTINKSRDMPELEIARRTRYLPVSAILEYLTSYPSKLGLMRVIWGMSSSRY